MSLLLPGRQRHGRSVLTSPRRLVAAQVQSALQSPMADDVPREYERLALLTQVGRSRARLVDTHLQLVDTACQLRDVAGVRKAGGVDPRLFGGAVVLSEGREAKGEGEKSKVR